MPEHTTPATSFYIGFPQVRESLLNGFSTQREKAHIYNIGRGIITSIDILVKCQNRDL